MPHYYVQKFELKSEIKSEFTKKEYRFFIEVCECYYKNDFIKYAFEHEYLLPFTLSNRESYIKNKTTENT